MVLDSAARDREGAAWPAIVRLTAQDGSLVQPWSRRLADGRAVQADLADAVHALCVLHGNHPGMAEAAIEAAVDRAAEPLFAAAARLLSAERGQIATIVAAAGPLPSTPGQAESQAALLGQRRALDLLARSGRTGCARGAVAALILDWPTVRAVLARAADRFGLTPDFAALPAIPAPGLDSAAERAAAFGAEQLLAQHRGLWNLLEARAEARARS